MMYADMFTEVIITLVIPSQTGYTSFFPLLSSLFSLPSLPYFPHLRPSCRLFQLPPLPMQTLAFIQSGRKVPSVPGG